LSDEVTLPDQEAGVPAPGSTSPSPLFKIIIGLMLVFLVAAVAIPLAVLQPWRSSTSPSPVSSGPAFTLGQANAPVTIDIYEDFQCPICHDWYQIVYPQLRDGAIASGEAKLVFHGLSALGAESVAADRAAFAAAQQGKFWQMWTTLYDHQGPTENGGTFSDTNLRSLAQNLGLDMTRYDADFNSTAAQTYVTDESVNGHAIGITGTPTLIIAGKQYQGVSTYEVLKPIIDAARP
jgi:protein-disulfide isomerase